jgi:hypothetical protein
VCGEKLPVHLGDYETGRDEVEVFCEKHIPENNCRIFTLTENEYIDIGSYCGGYEVKKYVLEFWEGWQMAMRYLTDNAQKNKEMNHPNIGADWTTKDI